MSNRERTLRGTAGKIVLILFIVAALGGVWWQAMLWHQSEVALANDCQAIFGVKMPNAKTSWSEYRSRKVHASRVLADLEEQSRQHGGNALAFEMAFEVYEDCFIEERIHLPPAL